MKTYTDVQKNFLAELIDKVGLSKNIRDSYCMHQKVFGDYIGVSDTSICMWEGGKRPKDKNIDKIADFMLKKFQAEDRKSVEARGLRV